MKRLRATVRVLLALTAAVGFAPLAAASPASSAPQATPAAPAAARVYRMASMLSYDVGWLPDSKRLAFIGNRREGEPGQIYVWEPVTNQLYQVTNRPAKRHSLVVSHDNRLAYVEHGTAAPPTQLDVQPDASRPADGPDTLIVRDLRTHASEAVLTNGWVLPGSLAWSPDGSRLSFITLDRSGAQRLAVVTPGSAIALVALDASYEMRGMVGWANAREVVLRAAPIVDSQASTQTLLVVGRDGIHRYRDAENAKMSPDGRWLLAKNGSGVALRLLTGGLRPLNSAANAYEWAPEADRFYAAVNRDVLMLDLKGRVLRRWSGLANLAVGQMDVSPDGRLLAFSADYGLSVMSVR